VVADLALSRPDAAFTCRVDGRTVVRTPGGSLRDALRAVLGVASAAELLDVDAPGDPGVTGAISEPRAHRAARNAVVLIVNGRRISHRGLTVAIEDAYRGLLPTGRFPYGVLAIDIDPTSVDVNVHPAKREVRFRDERAVFSAVQRACWHALQGSRPGVVAPGWSAGGAGTLGMLHVRDGGPASLPPGPPGSDGGGAAGALPVPPESLWPSRSAAHGQVPGPVPAEYGADASPVPPFAPDGAVQSAPGESWTDAGDAGRAAIHGAPAATVSGLPAMRAVGQVASTWMVAEAAGGVVLVDPHAAHEKVLYAELIEQWRAAPLGDGTAQLLLLPVAIECDPRQMAAGLAASDFLTRCGFILEEFGPGTLRCSAVPAVAGNADAGRLVADLLDQLADDSGPVHERQHRIAALIACHSAVRFGDPVGPAEQQRLLDRVVATAGGQTCPHGRPTVLVLDDAALRRAFRRPAAR
jgi:DNA mismatch repair protein MutL